MIEQNALFCIGIKKGGVGMRRRCNGAPIKWLGGVVLIAIGVGMFLACLIPKCVFLIGALLIGVGIWLISQHRRC